MEMQIINQANNVSALILKGDFDAEGSKVALPYIDEVLNDANRQDIVVHFTHVSFLDSSGIGALVYLYKRLVEQKREMRIEYVQGQPLEIMQLLRIDQTIRVNSLLEMAA
ncbi:STAS domain-containing protein [Vibrio sp. SCSIO 43136]|uniref:STAS domain-containing protein n=1 Tax=Vibrio sp. SCSIO 43136 TaxID=2819101 RepID=UPI00207502C8|nr:STAS domain-containing protein [Vibrio sp. SCSIO 43136]USD67803.1 STAS domain-containing protein [Vibrio sp. SCSIO 43136]